MNADPDAETVFLRARSLPEKERDDFLRTACSDRETLRRRVEALLAADAEAGGFLPVDSDGSERRIACPEEEAGAMIGRYKLLQRLGEGGMGTVWMAEQREPILRRVALKIIKLGMDTHDVVARFEQERQALAMMDHPAIARVLDAGATGSGRPYFVMELVRGVSVTAYCDEQKLGVPARLEIFAQICQAIQHAHQKGVIHRDIKPSNILVTAGDDGGPLPKVIDFGIAKATGRSLTDKTFFTQLEQIIGTPAYMSPEQAGLGPMDIDTRSDVYALGVLLYELLTGRPPFDPRELMSAGLDEMRRVIREQDPPKPSTRISSLSPEQLRGMAGCRHVDPPKFASSLRGDLDWIVMKALEKNRNRRYETAQGLAADIRRCLNHEPVVARPPRMAYRFGKFARRNKVVLGATSLIAASLVAATVFSTWQALRASRAEDRALERLREGSLSEARALRLSGMNGRRFRAMESLHTAANIRSGPDVRDEAIAILGVADLRPSEKWVSDAGLKDLGAVAPDFSCFATSRPDGAVSVFAMPGGEVVATRAGGGVPVNWVLRFSPDARWLAIGHAAEGQRTSLVTVWDWKRNVDVAKIDGVASAAADFSPDGSLLAVSLSQAGALIDVRTGERTRNWNGPPGFPHTLRFRPDGKAVAVSSLESGSVSVVDIKDGRVTARSAFASPRGLDWHRDGHRLAVACKDSVSIWDTAGPEIAGSIAVAPNAVITQVAWSHHTELLASTGWQQPVSLHDAGTRETLVVANGDVKDLRFSPDDTSLGLTWNEREIGLFEVADGHIARHAFGHSSEVRGCAWHSSGAVFATISEDALQFWNREMRAIGRLDLAGGRSVIFTPDSLIVVAGTVQRRSCRIEGNPPVLRAGPPETLDPRSGWQFGTASADGRRFAVAGHQRALVIDLARNEPPRETGEHIMADQAALSPDGKWLATGTYYGSGVKIWSVPNGSLAKEFPDYGRGRVAFSPDGSWLVIGTGGSYTFYRAGTWEAAHSLPCRLGNDLGWMAWSPRGTALAVEPEDYAVAIHEAHNFSLLAAPRFERQRPLSFSPDGALLATMDAVHRLHLWDLSLLRAGLGSFGADWLFPPLPPSNSPLVEQVVLEGAGEPSPAR